MQEIRLDSSFEAYSNLNELHEADQKLVLEARAAADDAYAPYSHFHVGAAVLLDNGNVIRGNNQENAAYPSGLCAERVAFFASGAQHSKHSIKAIAVSAYSEEQMHKFLGVSPCGDCRQVMAEYEQRYGQDIRLIMEAGDGRFIVSRSVKQMLPFLFSADSMK